MTRLHNITGSEAFHPRRALQIEELPKRQPRRSTVISLYLGAAGVGAVLALIDLAIGAPIPICLSVGAIAVLVAWLRA